jgi:hypothetical protein
MIIRVEMNGISNNAHGGVTHFRILVDGREIVQHHVVSRTSDKVQDVSFFGVTSVVPGEHRIEVQMKAGSGTITFVNQPGYGQFIHGRNDE